MEKEDLTKQLFELIPHVKEEEIIPQNNSVKELIGLERIMNIDASQIKNWRTSKVDLLEDEKLCSSKEVNGKTFQLSSKHYVLFNHLLKQIFDLEPYCSLTTLEFIEEHLFDWLIEGFLSKKVDQDPLNYLDEVLDQKVKHFNFYYKISALAIEKEIKLGDACITSFSEEDLEREYETFKYQFPKKEKREFDIYFNEFEKTPIIKISSKGTFERASSLAEYKAGLIIDVLKSALIDESIHPFYKMMDLEMRSDQNSFYTTLYNTNSERFDYQILTKRERVIPIQLTKNRVIEIRERGIQIIIDFINKPSKDEFDYVIIDALQQLSSISSTENLHERVVKIISFFEFLFMPINGISSSGKGESILKKKVLPRILLESEVGVFREIFRNLYGTRTKFLHNRIELKINKKEVFRIQGISFNLLKWLISKSDTMKSHQDLLDFFKIE